MHDEIFVTKEWRGLDLSDEQIRRLRELGPDQFIAELLQLDAAVVKEFLSLRGTIQCCAKSTRGGQCKRIVADLSGHTIPFEDPPTLIFHGTTYHQVRSAIREWVKLRELGVHCFSHGGDRGVLTWRSDGASTRLERERLERERAEERRADNMSRRQAHDAANPLEPSSAMLMRLGKLALSQLERLDFADVTDPEILAWLNAVREARTDPEAPRSS